MNNTLQLLTSEMFGTVQCDFYRDGNNVFMSGEQLGQALNYSNPQKAIDNIIARNPRLTSTEFSVTLKLRATDGKLYNTRAFTEDGIYEVSMLSRTDKAEEFRDFVRTVLKSVNRFGAYMTPDVLQQTMQDPDFLIGLLTNLKAYQAELTFARPISLFMTT